MSFITKITAFVFHIIFFLCTIILVKCDLSSESGNETLPEPFPKIKCESLLVNCSCYDYEVVAGIICNNKNDFTNFSNFLATDLIFEENTTYEITLSNTHRLPAKLLKGLIVFRLILDTPYLPAIDKDTFDGVFRLRRFHIRQSSIQEIPDFRGIRDSIRSINIDNSRLQLIKSPNLQDLPLIERLSFANNSIRYIDSEAFKGTDNAIIFDVSYNLLESLPPNMLDTWKKLRKFVATHNRLIQVDQLFKITHPKFIYLDFNNLTDVDAILHANMTNVETVLLANNPIKQITKKSFNFKVPNVRFIYLDHCLLREFDPAHYQNLSIMTVLDLSFNLIEEISDKAIAIGYNLELKLTGNQIRKFEGQISFNITRMYLSENKLQALHRTLQFTQIVEVSVARNELQYLSAEDFRGVHATANLELQGNKIRWIDRLTFVNIRNDLHYLDLSANFIPSLNGSIRFLSQLKALNMSDNLIRTFEDGEFTGLNELSELYLQYNRIIALSGQLQQLPQLQYLVVTHNNIETLSADLIPSSLRYLYLTDNPLNCNCRLLPFLVWLNSSDHPHTDIQLCPPRSDEETNSLFTCPQMCSCSCAEDGDDYFITVDCSSKNMSVIPPFLTTNFDQGSSEGSFDFRRSLSFDQNTDASYHIRDRVLGIDLENNSFKSLDSALFPANLIHLYLSNNKLKQLPESLLYTLPKLRRISLSGNPWECNCNTVGFKKWLLSKMEIIQDVNITRCTADAKSESELDGRVIWSLTDLDLCPADIGMYVSVAFGILVFLLLCLTSKIMYTKYELHIKVFLYSHGVTWVKERDIDIDKKYDAFISFSHKDESFVANEIISIIEGKDPNIRLCIHYRHFRPGEFIHDNIIYAVQNSKRTVLVLSKNFLESEWCLMEFRAAHVQALEDKVHRIIVVKVGDLPNDIDPAIKVYLDSTTYLTWGDKHFWNNLMYVLPTCGIARNPNPQNAGLKMQSIDEKPHV